MSRILIAEDEQRIAAFVEKGLRAAGFSVTIVGDGQQALDEARSDKYDLLVLDIGLPRIDGFAVMETLRGEGNAIAIIVLTARTSGQDVVAGLENGADDYLAKPFRFDELLARVRLRLKDSRQATDTVLSSGGLELDLRSRRINVDGVSVDLSAREFALAEEFLSHV
ncbi:MAG TPA: response regulator transcription factor, partial [Microbacteriaceae bacterium]|nr:response regulator transcription factor [Microbacteriaceae bacterium]